MPLLTPLFLSIRLLHVLLAAVWLGGVARLVFVVMPPNKEAGPAAVPLMGAIARRGLNGAAAAALTLAAIARGQDATVLAGLSDDGLVAWHYLDDQLTDGVTLYPIVRSAT